MAQDKTVDFAQFDGDVFDASNDQGGFLDLSGISDKIEYELIPPGVYNAVVENVEYGNSQRSGNPMLTWQFRIDLPDGRDRTLYYHTVLVDKGLPRLKRIITRLAEHANDGLDLTRFNPSQADLYFNGTPARVRVKTQTYEGQRRSSISDVLPPAEETADDFLS